MEWISVKDELPETGDIVLTFSDEWSVNVDYLTTAMLFTTDHPIHNQFPVTHWMPLPAPPQEKQDG